MGNYVATIFFREKTSRKSYIIFFCHISFSHSLTLSTALSTYLYNEKYQYKWLIFFWQSSDIFCHLYVTEFS